MKAVALAAVVLLGAAGTPGSAGPVLDRVRAEKTVRCAAIARPGLAAQQPDGRWAGLLVDVCAAAGMAAGGPDVRVVFDGLMAPDGFEAIRAGRDDIAFLTGAETVDHALGEAMLPGPPVYTVATALMVARDDPARSADGLAGAPICFLLGEPTERHLGAFFAARHLSFIRMGYQEEVEMLDAFDAGRCRGLAGEATALAADRLGGGATRRQGRILDDPLATSPLIAATPASDAAWGAILAWTLAALRNADRPIPAGTAGGPAGPPVAASAPGLTAGWQRGLVDAVGSYAASLRRHVGDGSPLRLPAGPNALASQGGTLTPPSAE